VHWPKIRPKAPCLSLTWVMGTGDGFSAIRLGEAIQRRRKAIGLSARHLGQRAGISGSYVGFIEAGRNQRPSVQVIAQLAAALDVSVDDLLREIGLPSARKLEPTNRVEELWPRLRTAERETVVRIVEAVLDLQDRYGSRTE
jgi:XRE family transcriptional regulator, master regulator for biofilm formation